MKWGASWFWDESRIVLYLKTLFKSTCEWGIVYNLEIQCPLGRTYLNKCLNACVFNCVCMCTQSCLTLCNRMDCSPQSFSVYGISQARILEWVAISFSRESSQSRIEHLSLESPALAGRFFTIEPLRKPKE